MSRANGRKRSKAHGGAAGLDAHAGSSVGVVARDAVAARAARLLDLLDRRRGRADADTIHDLRVASRRAREAVVLFRKWAPGKAARRARDAAREVTRALGTARNADVGAALLRGLGDGAWSRAAGALAARLERRARDSRRDVQATIGPKRVAALRTRLERFARALDEADGGGLDAIAPGAFARRVVAKRARRLFRRSESWADSADTEALHATRIASKKLRYAIEILEPLFGKGYRERHEMLKAIQDALGDYHDVALLLDEVARWERDGSPAMRAAGRGSWRALEARLLKERRASHERFLETMSGFTAVAFADYLLEPVEDRGAERGAAPRLAPAPVAPPAPRAAASADPGDPAP